MGEVKRGRGRPKGSETDDSAPLMMVARLLTDDPRLAPKTAMRRVFRGGSWGRSSEEASIHRWQSKWKTGRVVHLQRVQDERVEADRAKAVAEAERQQRQRAAQSTHTPSAWDVHASIYGCVPTSALSRAVELMNSPAVRSVTNLLNEAAVQTPGWMKALEQPAWMKAIEEPAWMKTERTLLERAIADNRLMSGALNDPFSKWNMSAAEKAALDFGCMLKLPKGF